MVFCVKSQISGEYEIHNQNDFATKVTHDKSAKSPFTSALLQMVLGNVQR